MKLSTSLTLTIFLAQVSSQISYGAQIVLGQNAIVNPGAEIGTGSSTGNDILPVFGWTTTGNFTFVQFNSSAAPVPLPGPSFGSNFFSGGPNTPTDQATQVIDVSNLASSIDAGGIAYDISGYFGGYLFQNDNATLFATFFSAANTVIANSAVVGGYNSTSRGNATQLLFDSGGGFIPAGTRSIEITLQMTRTEGFYNDGYADNLAFVAHAVGLVPLTPTPEPATWALLGIGAFALLVRHKRR